VDQAIVALEEALGNDVFYNCAMDIADFLNTDRLRADIPKHDDISYGEKLDRPLTKRKKRTRVPEQFEAGVKKPRAGLLRFKDNTTGFEELDLRKIKGIDNVIDEDWEEDEMETVA